MYLLQPGTLPGTRGAYLLISTVPELLQMLLDGSKRVCYKSIFDVAFGSEVRLFVPSVGGRSPVDAHSYSQHGSPTGATPTPNPSP